MNLRPILAFFKNYYVEQGRPEIYLCLLEKVSINLEVDTDCHVIHSEDSLDDFNSDIIDAVIADEKLLYCEEVRFYLNFVFKNETRNILNSDVHSWRLILCFIDKYFIEKGLDGKRPQGLDEEYLKFLKVFVIQLTGYWKDEYEEDATLFHRLAANPTSFLDSYNPQKSLENCRDRLRKMKVAYFFCLNNDVFRTLLDLSNYTYKRINGHAFECLEIDVFKAVKYGETALLSPKYLDFISISINLQFEMFRETESLLTTLSYSGILDLVRNNRG